MIDSTLSTVNNNFETVIVLNAQNHDRVAASYELQPLPHRVEVASRRQPNIQINNRVLTHESANIERQTLLDIFKNASREERKSMAIYGALLTSSVAALTATIWTVDYTMRNLNDLDKKMIAYASFQLGFVFSLSIVTTAFFSYNLNSMIYRESQNNTNEIHQNRSAVIRGEYQNRSSISGGEFLPPYRPPYQPPRISSLQPPIYEEAIAAANT